MDVLIWKAEVLARKEDTNLAPAHPRLPLLASELRDRG